MTETCGECGRVFDLLDPNDASEWFAGHDCEPDDRPAIEIYGTPEHEAWLLELERMGDI